MKLMKEIRSLLEDADPLRIEPGLTGADAERMRRAILSSASASEPARAVWPRACAVAAAVVLMVVGGTMAGFRLPARDAELAGEITVAEDAGERLQLQFATPGGTRVIWTLDPDFKLREVAP